jgi:hypothetical protein
MEVRQKWGDKAAEAAKIHIMRDWGLADQNDIPVDRYHACVLLAVIIEAASHNPE